VPASIGGAAQETGYMEYLLLITAIDGVEASNEVAVTNKTEKRTR
jgi:hypothetical protein